MTNRQLGAPDALADELTKKVQAGTAALDSQQTGTAIKIFEEVIKGAMPSAAITDEVIKAKENATYRLAKILKEKGLVDELTEL